VIQIDSFIPVVDWSCPDLLAIGDYMSTVLYSLTGHQCIRCKFLCTHSGIHRVYLPLNSTTCIIIIMCIIALVVKPVILDKSKQKRRSHIFRRWYRTGANVQRLHYLIVFDTGTIPLSNNQNRYLLPVPITGPLSVV